MRTRPAPSSRENPFRREYWIGEVDSRIPALFRIAIGIILLTDVADRLRDLFTFLTDSGVMPRAGIPLPRWSIFNVSGAPGPVAALFLVGFPIAIALAVGYRTRLATVLAWIYVNSLMTRNPYVCDGGDALLRVLLFWSMFADLGARWSVDSFLGRRAAQATVPSIGIRCLQLQIVMIYAFTFFAKNGTSWRDGTAVLLVLQNPQWSRALGPWLGRSPATGHLLTWATLAIEGAFPLLMLSPWRPRLTRGIGMILGTALHLGIFLMVRVGIFSPLMPASYVIFVAPEWIDRLEAVVLSRPSKIPSSSAGPPQATPWQARLRFAALLLLASTFIPALGAQLVGAMGKRVPRPLATWLGWFSLEQNWKMFGPDPPRFDTHWTAPGVLVDGSTVELGRVIAPGLERPNGFLYTRWHKLGNNLIGQPEALLRGVGAYICRRYNGDFAGPKLERFELNLVVAPLDGSAPPTQTTMLRQRCVELAPGTVVAQESSTRPGVTIIEATRTARTEQVFALVESWEAKGVHEIDVVTASRSGAVPASLKLSPRGQVPEHEERCGERIDAASSDATEIRKARERMQDCDHTFWMLAGEPTVPWGTVFDLGVSLTQAESKAPRSIVLVR